MPFDWSVFWSAFGALVGFTGVLGGWVFAIRAFLRRRSWRHLQEVLNRERRIYEETARRISPPTHQSNSGQYVEIVKHGLLGLAGLPRLEKLEIRKRLSELVRQLRTTHDTLVETLSPFMVDDAKKFIDDFSDINSSFGDKFAGDKIASEARTHCHSVAQLAHEIANDLRNDDSITIDESTLSQLDTLGYQIDDADSDIIVPTMLSLIARTEVELSLIDSALKVGEQEKALWLKERFRFEIRNNYKTLKEGLDRMDQLANSY